MEVQGGALVVVQWKDIDKVVAGEVAKLIRTQIEKSELSRYEIAKRSGVSESVLSRFVNGKGSLTLDNIERLAPIVGITISAPARAIMKRKKTK
jgi:transcriptional regulator with XRE-family HTH domain